MKAKNAGLLVFLLVAVGTNAIAEDPAEVGPQFEIGPRYADTQAASMELLKQYTWHTDTYLEQNGETKFHFKLACRLNEKGEMVREVEDSESTVRRKRGFRGLAQQSQAEEARELLDQIVEVTASYMYMTREQEVAFFKTATITDGTGDDAGKLLVQGANVTVKGDKVIKAVDPNTFFPVRITYESIAGETPISGEVLYRPIEGGPNVPRMATIKVPSKEGEVTAEFVDYAKQL